MSIYIISPEAIQDLDEISEYFASRNLDAGDRFVNSFEEIEAIASPTNSFLHSQGQTHGKNRTNSQLTSDENFTTHHLTKVTANC